MNCLEFRQRIGAEPTLFTPETEAHEKSCSACAQFRQDLLKMDRLIHRALSIEPQARTPTPVLKPSYRPVRWATAAVLVIGIMIGVSLWMVAPRNSLAVELVNHAKGEPESLVATRSAADPEQVAGILAQSRVRLRNDALLVSYVHRCWFRGHYVPHLAVQTASGPVTVMVLADEKRVAGPQSFNEAGFHGVLLPAPRGILAVLGNGIDASQAAQKVVGALDYQN